MKKKFTKSKSTSRTNGSGRRAPKAVGHEGGKRVAALRHRLTGPRGETLWEGNDKDLKAAGRRVGRANVIPSNGALPTSTEVAPEKVSIGEAMRLAVEELGETVITDELAPAQLRQLGEAYEQVTREQAAYAKKSEEAKTAKKSLDGATEHLLGLVKEFTHPKPLPLFDQKEAETDREAMIAGGDVETVNDATELGLDEA